MANQTVIGTSRVRPGAEKDFTELLTRHWPTLRELGFVTDEPAVVYRGLDEKLTYVEIFTWTGGGYEHAREHPAVLAIWGRMDELLEERDGRPKWDFPHFERVDFGS